MNEIVYNILRKCVESPEKVELESQDFLYFRDYHIKVCGVCVLKLEKYKTLGTFHNESNSLTDKECRRILRAMEHVEAMKIRNL